MAGGFRGWTHSAIKNASRRKDKILILDQNRWWPKKVFTSESAIVSFELLEAYSLDVLFLWEDAEFWLGDANYQWGDASPLQYCNN